MTEKPILGITMGDVCGIGPEITAKLFTHNSIYDRCRPLVVGNAGALQRAISLLGLDFGIHVIDEVSKATFSPGTIDVYHVGNFDLSEVPYGIVSVAGGKAAFESVVAVIELAMANEIDGTITGPLNKEAMNLAGHHFNGHTEIYAHYTKTKDYSMMLAEDNLRIVHVSTHVSLRKACDLVKKERVLKVIQIAHNACVSLGIPRPKIAVAGLNPHGGENGLFGDEEINEIIPAIEEARLSGLQVEGPISGDTVFSKANGGFYDIVVAMYHDQGHIALKMIGFVYDRTKNSWKSVTGVNITLGLPIVRASVDHGTAFDQAGKKTASEESLLNALDYGAKLAISRKKQLDE